MPLKLHVKSLTMRETGYVAISHLLLSHGRYGPTPIFSFLSRLQPYLDNTHVHHFQQVYQQKNGKLKYIAFFYR